MESVKATRTYTFIVTEREADSGPYADAGIFGFTDAADFRAWLEKQLAEFGPFDAEYVVQVSA